jgi:hypothetical protein
LIRWAYEALCINELSGLRFVPEKETGPLAISRGEQLLESIGYSSGSISKPLMAQALITLMNYIFTYSMLVAQTPKVEPAKSIFYGSCTGLS